MFSSSVVKDVHLREHHQQSAWDDVGSNEATDKYDTLDQCIGGILYIRMLLWESYEATLFDEGCISMLTIVVARHLVSKCNQFVYQHLQVSFRKYEVKRLRFRMLWSGQKCQFTRPEGSDYCVVRDGYTNFYLQRLLVRSTTVLSYYFYRSGGSATDVVLWWYCYLSLEIRYSWINSRRP